MRKRSRFVKLLIVLIAALAGLWAAARLDVWYATQQAEQELKPPAEPRP